MASDDAIKRFEVVLDLIKTLPTPAFEVVQGDTGNVISVKICNDGEDVLLEDKLVVAVFASSAGTSFQSSEDGGVTLSGSTAEISLLPTAIGAGLVSCELQVYASAEEAATGRDDYDVLVTSARFCFRCRKPLLNDESIAAIPQAPLLTSLLAEAGDAEADRALAEAARAEAEAARALAEAARQRAEAARDLSESMREAAEEARQAAEAEREQDFAAMIAQAAGGAITGSGEPAGTLSARAGQLYLDTANRQLYVCTAVREGASLWRRLQPADGDGGRVTVERNSTYLFSQLPNGEAITLQELVNRLAGWYTEIDSKQDGLTFDSAPTANSANPAASGGVYDALHYGDWVTLYDSSIQSDTGLVNITRRDSAHGGDAFAFDELKLVMIGGMTGGTAARVYVNSYTSSYMVFNQFGVGDPAEPGNCAAVLCLEKPVGGVVTAERSCGGDPDDEGRSQSMAAHRAVAVLPGVEKYSALRLTGDNAATRFGAGTRFILQGRNAR